MNLGDIKLNGKFYRVDTKSYRVKDAVDFSPRAGTPGGSVIYSELLLYQPMAQVDWRHGFGKSWYEDSMSYLCTDGNIDTRNPNIAMMFTQSMLSDNAVGAGTNLISNGDFETGDLTNWSQAGTVGTNYTASTASPHEGTYSLKCDTVANASPELLTNGGAELGALTNWTKTETAGAWTVVTTAPTPQAGTYSFKWKPTNIVNKGVLTSDRILVTAGNSYLASGYIYSLTASDHAKMEVKFYNHASAGTLISTEVIGTTEEIQEFIKYEKTMVAPLSALSVTIVLTITNLSTTTDYAAFDTVSFALSSAETLTSDRYSAVGGKAYEMVAYSKDVATVTTTTLQPADADTYITNQATSINYGTATSIGVGRANASNYTQRTLLKFAGLSNGTIPSKAKISSATLSLMALTDNASVGGTFNVYRIRKVWNAGVASWFYSNTGTAWSSNGAFHADDCEQSVIASTALTQAETLDAWKAWVMDNDKLTEIVNKAWTNNGFLIKTALELNDQYLFYSSNHATTANRPKLAVTYTEYPDYTMAVNWYDAASAGNLIRSDTLIEQNNTASWTRRSARVISPSNALSFTITVVATQGTAFYLDNIDFHLASGNKQGFFTWNNATWAYGQGGLYKYSAGAWSTIYSTAGVNYALPAGDYLFFCPDGARIQKIDTAGTITDSGNDTSSIDYKWLLSHNGFIYAGKDETNHIHRDSTADLSDLEGTTADPDIIYVGTSNYPTIGAVEYAGSMYIMRLDGLWQLGEDNIARRILDFTSEASPDNFRGTAVHNGMLVFPIRDILYQWNGARLSDITPPQLNDSFPYSTYGRFDNLTAVGRFLFCTARTNETDYSEDLLCFDGVAWFKLMRMISGGKYDITGMGYDPLNNYLWYNLAEETDKVYYIQFQAQSELPFANFPTTGTHELSFSRWDMGYRRVDKSSPTVEIEASNVSSNSYLTVYYALDDGDWIKWDDIKTNGVTKLNNPGGNRTVEYKYIMLKIRFTTTDSTQSPILEGVTLRFLMRPDTLFGWSMNIPIAQNSDIGVTTEGRISTKAVRDLKEARDSKSPIEFVDVIGETYYVHISSISQQLVQIDRDGMGKEPETEYVIQLNLVQVK